MARVAAMGAVALLALLLIGVAEGARDVKTLVPHEGDGQAGPASRQVFEGGAQHLHTFTPAWLVDLSRLWSQVELRVTCEEDGFQVVYGNSEEAVRSLVEEVERQLPPEASFSWFSSGDWRAEAAHAFRWLLSDAKQEVAYEALCWWPWAEDQSECVVKLQAYGEKGSVLPRLSWRSEPAQTYIAVVPTDPSQRCQVELRQSQRWTSHALLFFAGVLLYRNSAALGGSLKLYLLSWFVAGTVFSGVAIALVVLYFVAKQARLSRMGLVNGIAAFMILSWSSLLVSIRSWVPSLTSLMYNKYLVGLMLMGGVVGFVRGYKSELSQENKDIMRMFFKIVAVCLVYFSCEHPEVALLLVLLVSVADSRTYLRVLLLLVQLPLQVLLAPFRIVWSAVKHILGVRPYKEMLSEAEYVEQSRVATGAGLEELVQAIREDPRKISLLSDTAQRMVGKLLRGEDHLGVVMAAATGEE